MSPDMTKHMSTVENVYQKLKSLNRYNGSMSFTYPDVDAMVLIDIDKLCITNGIQYSPIKMLIDRSDQCVWMSSTCLHNLQVTFYPIKCLFDLFYFHTKFFIIGMNISLILVRKKIRLDSLFPDSRKQSKRSSDWFQISWYTQQSNSVEFNKKRNSISLNAGCLRKYILIHI